MIPLSQQLLDREGLILPWIKTRVAQYECNGGAIWVLLSWLFCFIFAFIDKGHYLKGFGNYYGTEIITFSPDDLRHCSDIGPCVKITSDFFCLCFWKDNGSCVCCTWTFQLHMRAYSICVPWQSVTPTGQSLTFLYSPHFFSLSSSSHSKLQDNSVGREWHRFQRRKQGRRFL